MSWSEADLIAQFQRVVADGWTVYFLDAAARTGFPAELLLAVGSRETNLRNIKGDFRDGQYHGFGVMQVDIGTDLAFCHAWNETRIRESIDRGADILAGKRNYLVNKGIAASLQGIAAAYNTGEGNVYRSLKVGASPDRTTTGGDYGADVLARMKVFARLLWPTVEAA